MAVKFKQLNYDILLGIAFIFSILKILIILTVAGFFMYEFL